MCTNTTLSSTRASVTGDVYEGSANGSKHSRKSDFCVYFRNFPYSEMDIAVVLMRKETVKVTTSCLTCNIQACKQMAIIL